MPCCRSVEGDKIEAVTTKITDRKKTVHKSSHNISKPEIRSPNKYLQVFAFRAKNSQLREYISKYSMEFGILRPPNPGICITGLGGRYGLRY